MEMKTGKRIVSKGAYAAAFSMKIGWCVGAFMFLMIVSLLAANAFSRIDMSIGWILAFLFLFVLCFLPLGLFILAHAFNKSQQVETGVPLTRHNTADLPVADSLVRASSEPLQAQEAVLLRAAAEGQQKPTDEMLRASAGQK